MKELEELYNELNELYKVLVLEYDNRDSLIDKSRLVGKMQACVDRQRIILYMTSKCEK